MMPVVQDQHPAVPAREVCRLLAVSRSTHDRQQQAQQGSSADEARSKLKAEVEAITLEFSRYGYRRVTKELHRRNQHVNHKKVLKLMRAEGLLCKPRRRWVRTTQSRHDRRRYPNLIQKLTPTRVNQVWHADLTYVRVKSGFVYLACVLDGFSRRIVGWALSMFLDAEVAIEALSMAIQVRNPLPGALIHHSDQGVQYASDAYVGRLEGIEAQISMSRTGNPYDNAKMEAFMGTLKAEEVDLGEYEDDAEARANIGPFIERVYNEQRLHSSLGYVPPVEFEAGIVEVLAR